MSGTGEFPKRSPRKRRPDPEQEPQTFRLIFEGHSSVMLLIEPDTGEILDANRAAEAFYGHPREKLRRMSMDAITVLQEHGGVFGEERNCFDFSHRLASGEVRNVEVHSSLIQLNERRVIFSIIHDITERRRAEDALQATNEELNHYFTTSLDLFCIADTDGRFHRLNPEWEKTLGYSVTELEGKRFLDFVHPDDLDATLTAMAQLNARQAILNFENRYRCKDGSYRWIEWRSFPTGKLIHAAARDITKRKQAEDALRVSEEKYRTVADFTYDWEAWRSPDGSYLYNSPSCYRVSRHTPEEFQEDAQLLVKITHPDDQPLVRQHFQEITHHLQDQDAQLDFRIITPEGETRWISHHCMAVFNDEGRWLGRRESNRDITIRKQMEQELQTQRDFATQVINAMGQGLTVTDASGCFEFVNPAYARLFGYQPSELLGKHPSDVTAPEDQAALAEQRARRTAGESTSYQSRLRRADGSIAQVLITGVPRGRNGIYAGAIAVITDVTEQKRIEEELREAKSALEKVNGELSSWSK
jgi:PAS domain S-box-containing protein